MPFHTLIESGFSTSELSASQSLPDMTFDSAEEELVLDYRSALRPAQMVEDKLTDMLKGDGLMVSQLRLKRLIGQRS